MVSIEKLLTNEEFIKWVKNPTKENDLFWREWLKSNPDKVNDVNRAKDLIHQFNFRKATKDDERFNRVLKNILLEKDLPKQSQDKKKIHPIGFETLIKVAAVFLFLLTFTFIIRLNYSTPPADPPIQLISKQNSFGQKSTFILPDSTIVTLNSGSNIHYPEKFSGKFRDVEVDGEAYFDVAKDKDHPFRIKSKGINTIALGTSFNVRAFENESIISVSLNTGNVIVNYPLFQHKDSLILNPGEKIVYNPSLKKAEKLDFDRELELAWKDGILVFEQTNLQDFIRTIERWYGVNVELIGNTKLDICVKGRFDNETLKVVLESLEFSRDLVEYELNEKNVKLLIKS